MFGVRDAIPISFIPGPVGPLVFVPAAAQLSPVRLGIGMVRRIQRASDDNDNMSVRIGVGLLRSFQPADNELPSSCALGGRSPVAQRRPAVPSSDRIDDIVR